MGAGSSTELIWTSYWRLGLGRFVDLKLVPCPGGHVVVGGLFPDYLPLITQLSGRWDVLPFAFDWRIDVDDSARALAERIRSWAGGEPVHVVAHSMGGLVARRMSQLAPDVWRSMRDGDVARRGGRLIQLGTPNRGSLAIPMALTGDERLVRMLPLLDLRHSLAELLDVLCTFIGSYQMLPAPEPKGDDRMHLFERQTWGSAPVSQPLLDRGRALQEAMAEVIDPERIVYVAGYD